MKIVAISVILLLFSNVASSQIDLTKSRIVADTTLAAERTAALMMQDHVQKIGGVSIEIVKPKKRLLDGDIVLGSANKEQNTDVTIDGFAISTTDGRLRITGIERGVIYGVADVLEKYFGVNYWAPYAIDIPRSETMILAGDIDYMDNPAFEHRQVNGFGTTDLAYRTFNRLEKPEEIFVPGYWVHTFLNLVPVDVYGESNPEYYAEIKGVRHPGHGTQLCLTNDEVFDIIVHKVDSLFKLYPDRKMISVSQNDSQYSYCQCPKCKALDDKEEALSGAMVHFMNRLGARFPEKEVSMLAYNYSVTPPKHVKPLSNVNIMLCNIESYRQLPLVDMDNRFVEAITKWGKISNNIFMWDYGINFSGTVSPFPNFHVLQPNMQLFHKNNVTKMFEQINASKGVDFSELRSYMLAKLIWDPYQDGDKLMKDFVWGYYKEAAPYIYDYLKLQQGGLLASRKPLWIYDTPATHKDGFLNEPLLKEYNRLFDKAEDAVKDNQEILDRVRLSRLSLQYAELECLRSVKDKDAQQTRKKVDLFQERAAYLEVTSINERNNTAQEYCEIYRERYLPTDQVNKASGLKVEWLVKPNRADKQEHILTDGLYGGSTFNDGWVGWSGVDGEILLDLGKETEISSISSDFLQLLSSWVFLPSNVVYEISSDGENFTEFDTVEIEPNKDWKVQYVKFTAEKPPVKTRYIKIKIAGVADCPSWHPGVGHTGWVFIDEIIVK